MLAQLVIYRLLRRLHLVVLDRECPPEENLGVPRPWFTDEQLATRLDALAAQNERKTREKLDWRNSEVDLRKLIGEPSDLATRTQDAAERGFDGKPGSAEMNTFLHEHTMRDLRAHLLPTSKAGDA